MNKNIFLLSSVLMATTATAVRANEVQTTLARVNSSYIQKEDTTETAGNDHGVMLNAKDATEPRQVEIGLPMSYTAVTVDGLQLFSIIGQTPQATIGVANSCLPARVCRTYPPQPYALVRLAMVWIPIWNVAVKHSRES